MSKNNHLREVTAEDEVFEAQVSEALEEIAEAKADTSSKVIRMISTTNETLTHLVEVCRKFIGEREAEKAAAHKEYEMAVLEAKQKLDQRLAAADADLHQVRYTLEAVEPARAKLAERV